MFWKDLYIYIYIYMLELAIGIGYAGKSENSLAWEAPGGGKSGDPPRGGKVKIH